MTLLAIESATDMVGVALLHDGSGSAERVHVGGRAHAELLVPAIEEVCAVSGCTVGEIDRIAVDVGPGLFTGLRVGVATAKALAQALGIGVLGVTSLDVLAAAAAAAAVERSGAAAGRPVVAVVDARRGEVFAARYRFDRAAVARDALDGRAGADDDPAGLADPVDPAAVREDRGEPVSPEELMRWLAELTEEAGPVAVVGDGAVRYRELLSVRPSLDLALASALSGPPPLALARLAARRLARGAQPLAPEELVPEYRRAADARINWEERAPRSHAPGTADRRPS